MSWTLIEKLEALKEDIYYVDGRPNLAPFAGEVNSVVDKAIALVRQHQAEQPQEEVERVITCLRKVFAARWKHTHVADGVVKELAEAAIAAMPSRPMNTARVQLICSNLELEAALGKHPDLANDPLFNETISRNKDAIAAMVDGSATIAPVAGEPDSRLAPASEAYRKVEEALRVIASGGVGQYRWSMTKAEETAREALAALPALKPQTVDQSDEKPVCRRCRTRHEVCKAQSPDRESGGLDVLLVQDAITKITKAAANLVNGEGFTSSFAEDHRKTTPRWVIDSFIRDEAKRTYLGNDIAQALNWLRAALAEYKQRNEVEGKNP